MAWRWLKDNTLDDPDLLPPLDEVAAEIVESLQTALDRFRNVAKALGEGPAQIWDAPNAEFS